jgi:hypothetical protein
MTGRPPTDRVAKGSRLHTAPRSRPGLVSPLEHAGAGVSPAPLPVALAGEVRRLLVEALLADLRAHPIRPPRRHLPSATVGTPPGHARSQGEIPS